MSAPRHLPGQSPDAGALDRRPTGGVTSPGDVVIHAPHETTTLTLAEVVDGLLATPRRLPAKAFYDERGAILFEEITRLHEYYLTRTEREILHASARNIATVVGQGGVVIEYGSGAADKSRILLHALRPRVFVPIDISSEQLSRVAGELEEEYPEMAVRPIVSDFSAPIILPADIAALNVPKLALFLGSTIGNFHPEEATAFVDRVHHTVGSRGMLLLGADLRKDPKVLHAAYNDARGVTAAFNKNVLERLQREFGARLNLDAFTHYAFYEPVQGRIEMHLIANRDTAIDIGGHVIPFEAGEGIWTESSYKFTRDALDRLGQTAGFPLVRTWLDRRSWFSLALYGSSR